MNKKNKKNFLIRRAELYIKEYFDNKALPKVKKIIIKFLKKEK